MAAVRRLLAILLLAVFALPLCAPLFAAGGIPDSALPACCRRNGKHHCMMSLAARQMLLQHPRQFRTPEQRCPFCPRAVLVLAHGQPFTPSPAQTVSVPVITHPAGRAQTLCRLRIARERTRHKRGPPSSSSLPA